MFVCVGSQITCWLYQEELKLLEKLLILSLWLEKYIINLQHRVPDSKEAYSENAEM